jgi:signal transduction histidine kinase
MHDFHNLPKNQYGIWLPAIVLLLGTASIVLLLVANRINERRLIEADIAGAVMEAKSLTLTAHLWLEEAITGDVSVDVKKIFEDYDKAINLIDVTLKGGAADHDWIPEPIQDPDQRSRAEEIKSMLLEFTRLSHQRLENPAISMAGSVVDQEYDKLFKKFTDNVSELEILMEIDEAKNDKAFGRLFPMSLLAWAFIVVGATASLFILERRRKEFKKGLIRANDQLSSQALELTEHRTRLAELVDLRTAELKSANKCLQIEMAERLQTCEILHQTEKQNHYLSNRLVSAQETERRRISMELHDELGQSLNVIKLQLRVIEKGSKSKRGDCEGLLEYMDQVIDDVRRISMDLSPTVLEDLGLSAALQWLTDNLKKDPKISITTDVETIDHLFSKTHWITIYRIAQEALTNIVKHAGAEHVSFVTRREGDRVAFAVEDDGNGFDDSHGLTRESTAKGYGLTTMSERVKIMGGDFDLWSRVGNGTRVTFSIPVDNGGS